MGKTRLALAPMQNHWWQVTLYVNARGLGTSPMPCRERRWRSTSISSITGWSRAPATGQVGTLALEPIGGEFYREVSAMLARSAWTCASGPCPRELPDAVPFIEDREHGSYDSDAAEPLLAGPGAGRPRAGAVPRPVPRQVQPGPLLVGAFDLSCTRFSGGRPRRIPGGIPNLADRVTREAYSHECISAGWWPGRRRRSPSRRSMPTRIRSRRGCPDAPIAPGGGALQIDAARVGAAVRGGAHRSQTRMPCCSNFSRAHTKRRRISADGTGRRWSAQPAEAAAPR